MVRKRLNVYFLYFLLSYFRINMTVRLPAKKLLKKNLKNNYGNIW